MYCSTHSNMLDTIATKGVQRRDIQGRNLVGVGYVLTNSTESGHDSKKTLTNEKPKGHREET